MRRVLWGAAAISVIVGWSAAACGIADINCDGIVDDTDTQIVFSRLGPVQIAGPIVDVNRDGRVDSTDGAIVAAKLGTDGYIASMQRPAVRRGGLAWTSSLPPWLKERDQLSRQ